MSRDWPVDAAIATQSRRDQLPVRGDRLVGPPGPAMERPRSASHLRTISATSTSRSLRGSARS
eukprot:4423052-Alexandrium_andersonii.AAC.1